MKCCIIIPTMNYIQLAASLDFWARFFNRANSNLGPRSALKTLLRWLPAMNRKSLRSAPSTEVEVRDGCLKLVSCELPFYGAEISES